MELKQLFNSQKNENANAWKGIVAGAIGGMIGIVVVDLFARKIIGEKKEESESPAVRAVNGILEVANQKELSAEQQKQFDKFGKYPFGAALGLGYGVLAEHYPIASENNGLVLSSLLFTATSGNLPPALSPTKIFTTDFDTQEDRDLVALMVFGITTEIVRRGIRKLLK